ncbi:MAG: nodulation protein NodN [Alcanivoracaceae bacterium]|uniref:MaoC family dehydratase n=1 Tax=Alcanivorax sp. MD8A TaxID=1177157 RepID=UPI000C582920|nr:MaoC family dehydratase [Alcanivorax sp. MD8A]MAX54659.1 nodulation protein NodN [Alcanivoracaceae bacterium]MCG8438712.1 MaoC family dehydratase [Pseudomonadales bacterium]MEE2870386.1 MaoC family dehydratase [Pseudomonadota bacterium]PNE02481.1 oxidoreductase [Alcanivorax sp. MD8A]|tara:strand:- start:219 stop:689 length:471 start_codon:yes stop_codon:yes gene_type:complete
MSRETVRIEDLQTRIGESLGQSTWRTVDQQRIDGFADLTEDPQWIHTDPARAAKESPFGATIAHGFLSLSLLSAMAMDVLPAIEGQVMGINYGFDKVRFMNPVREGSKVRGQFTLMEVKRRSDNEWQLRHGVQVEIEGQEKPALIAEWLSLVIVPA